MPFKCSWAHSLDKPSAKPDLGNRLLVQSSWSSAVNSRDLIGQNYSLPMAALLTAFTRAHLFLVFFNLLHRSVPLNFLKEALKHPVPTTWPYSRCLQLPVIFYSSELFAVLCYKCASTAEKPPVKPGMCCLYSIRDFRRPNPTAYTAFTHYRAVKGGAVYCSSIEVTS